MLKAGEKVDFTTPLYKEKQSEETKFFLSDKLGVAPDKIFRHLKKFVGDEVKKGEVIAEKKSFLESKKVLSDIDGILKEINHNEGYVLLDIKSSTVETKNCFFTGEIVGVDKHEIKLKVNSLKEYPIKETINIKGEYIGNKVYYFTQKHGEFNEDDIMDKLVIFADDMDSYHQVKLEALGAAGFVGKEVLHDATTLPYAKLKNIEDIKTILKHQLPYCIIDKKESKIILYD